MSDYLRLTEISRHLRVRYKTIYNLVVAGVVPVETTPGGQYRVKVENAAKIADLLRAQGALVED